MNGQVGMHTGLSKPIFSSFVDIIVQQKIFNITYPDRRLIYEIEGLVGQPFSFLQRIRMKGIGTSKMILLDCSERINELFDSPTDTRYCNIELREKGIVVGFNSVMRIFAWCIPYYMLVTIYQSGVLSIRSQEDFMVLGMPFNGRFDKKFLLKMTELKSQDARKRDARS